MNQVDTLWDEMLRFENPQTYYVDLSQKLYDMKQELIKELHLEGQDALTSKYKKNTLWPRLTGQRVFQCKSKYSNLLIRELMSKQQGIQTRFLERLQP